jgi:hypothetical protein
MIDWFLHRRLAAFEGHYDYDASYLHRLLKTSRRAFLRFSRATAMGQHRDGVPLEPWFAAKLVAASSEDCGPCTQLGVDFAREAGIPDAVVRAVLRDDTAALPADAAVAVRYARAAIAHSADLPAATQEVVWRWGERGLVSLAFAITGTRLYPMLKYALGEGHACLKVTVGGESVAVARTAPARMVHAA